MGDRGKKWYVYMLELSDGSFYTGMTNDLIKRFKTHEEGRGSKLIRSRLPFKVCYIQYLASRSLASRREAGIKKYGRVTKIGLAVSGWDTTEKIIAEYNIPRKYWHKEVPEITCKE